MSRSRSSAKSSVPKTSADDARRRGDLLGRATPRALSISASTRASGTARRTAATWSADSALGSMTRSARALGRSGEVVGEAAASRVVDAHDDARAVGRRGVGGPGARWRRAPRPCRRRRRRPRDRARPRRHRWPAPWRSARAGCRARRGRSRGSERSVMSDRRRLVQRARSRRRRSPSSARIASVCSPSAGTGSMRGPSSQVPGGSMRGQRSGRRADLAPAAARLQLRVLPDLVHRVDARVGDLRGFEPLDDLRRRSAARRRRR